jgi:hypothetical protein
MSFEKKPKKRLIGYARVSTQQQELPRQTKALKHKTTVHLGILHAPLQRAGRGFALALARYRNNRRSPYSLNLSNGSKLSSAFMRTRAPS